jgi:hypothetical protein
MVYSNPHLKTRDERNFEELQKVAGFTEEIVSFHVGLSFDKEKGGVFIIDEADTLIFNDPSTFKSFIGDSMCVCLTATPDDSDSR